MNHIAVYNIYMNMNISKMSVERPLCSLHIAAATGLQFYDTFRYVCSLFGLLFHSKSVHVRRQPERLSKHTRKDICNVQNYEYDRPFSGQYVINNQLPVFFRNIISVNCGMFCWMELILRTKLQVTANMLVPLLTKHPA